MKRLIISIVFLVLLSGCGTVGNRQSTFIYNPDTMMATFDGRTNEKLTAKFPDGTEIIFDRTGGEGILAKILAILAIMPKMEVGTD